MYATAELLMYCWPRMRWLEMGRGEINYFLFTMSFVKMEGAYTFTSMMIALISLVFFVAWAQNLLKVWFDGRQDCSLIYLLVYVET